MLSGGPPVGGTLLGGTLSGEKPLGEELSGSGRSGEDIGYNSLGWAELRHGAENGQPVIACDATLFCGGDFRLAAGSLESWRFC